MDAVLPDGWGEFAVAAAGATGALTGLLIVTISVNVRQILASRALVYGAGSTVASLLLAVVVSLLMLIPHQPAMALGIEVLVATLPAAVLQLRAILIDLGARSKGVGFTARVVVVTIAFAVLQYLPFIVAIVLLLIGSGAGMYLLAAGVILTVVAAMTSAWVLLIEVLR